MDSSTAKLTTLVPLEQEITKPKKKAVQKSDSAYKTIGEVAEQMDVPQHVLRFWEEKFTALKPIKRGGRRYYQPEDIEILKRIKILLYQEGYTIKGVQRLLQNFGKSKEAVLEGLSTALSPQSSNDKHLTDNIKKNIDEIISDLNNLKLYLYS